MLANILCNNISFKFSFYELNLPVNSDDRRGYVNLQDDMMDGDRMCISISFQRLIFLLCIKLIAVQNDQ